jgi:hypothetical protein
MFATFILVLYYRYDRVIASLWIRYPRILLGEELQLASVRLQIILCLRNANTNALIFEANKKILKGEKKGKWAEVMQRAIWNHNTMVCRATNFTPFQLLFGAEAVLPKEIKHKSLRTTM